MDAAVIYQFTRLWHLILNFLPHLEAANGMASHRFGLSVGERERSGGTSGASFPERSPKWNGVRSSIRRKRLPSYLSPSLRPDKLARSQAHCPRLEDSRPLGEQWN